MITRKQYPNHHVFETSIGGRPFTVETGKVAELADAECICRYGDTVVLTTVTCSPDPKPGIDYFPLTIEFEERMYAVGRIPGSFNRREGKPSERGILNSRIIDRPMRPLFDDELRNDVVVTCTVLANDYENPVEIVASLGASISVACSDVPWNGPIATTNVAYVGGQYVINPSAAQRSASECFVCIASTFEKVVMIETEAKEAPENIVLECIRIAHETNMEVVKFINTIVETIGKPKFTFEKAAVNHDLLDDLCAYGMNQIEYALDTDDKNVREERLTAARRDFADKFAEKYEDFDVNIEVCLYKMQKKSPDGRDPPARRRGRRSAARPRLRPVLQRPDAGPVHLHAQHTVRRAEARHHLSGRDEALYPPLQLPVVLHRRGQSKPLHLPPRDRPWLPRREGPAACDPER